MATDLSKVRVNGERLWQTHLELAEIGALPNGGCCRLSLSDEDREARDLFADWCRDAGCRLDVDRAGNMFATRPGKRKAPPVASGSHLDTQPHGGRFDGIFGVMAALEAIRTMNDNAIETELPVAAVNWTNEEGVRFPAGILGSTAYAGRWSQEDLHALQSTDGARFGAELERIGYDGDIGLGEFAMTAFYEAHIEQGPVLEREGLPVGIVNKVQGLRWIEVTVTGADRHAGTTPMDARQDSLVAAARMIVALEALGLAHAPDARVTVGRLDVSPNSGSTIPGETTFNIDIRHPDDHVLDVLENKIGEICSGAETRRVIEMPPVDFDGGCVGDLEGAAQALGIPHRPMLSGALHDASPVATLVPAAMIFVPCRDGISHNEAEWAEPEHLQAGCNVILHAMLSRAGVV
ncbi:MAG: Zn-dependent hydrolase [Hyphomicrobiales bacterium]